MEHLVRFEVPMVVTINITVFWDAKQSSINSPQLQISTRLHDMTSQKTVNLNNP